MKQDADRRCGSSHCSSDHCELTDAEIERRCEMAGTTMAEVEETVDRFAQTFIDLAEEAHPAIRQIVKDAMHEVGLTKSFAELRSTGEAFVRNSGARRR